MLSPTERVIKEEMERRHALVLQKMKEEDLEILLLSGVRFVGSIGYLRYLTNWAEPFAGETLLFPIEGTPVFFARTSERALLVENLLGGMETVTGSTAPIVAEYLKKTGKKKVGICGLKTMFADYYVQLCSELPGVEFKDHSALMDEVRMVKSSEELQWVDRSANLGDVAFKLFSSLVQEGREEGEIFLEVEHLVKRLGAENTYFMMAADPKPVAKFIDLAFDHYAKGDLIFFNAEIAGPGGYYTQLVRTLSLGKPNREAVKAAEVCLNTLRVVEDMLQPGVMTNDIYKAIVQSIESSGFRIGLHPGHSQGLDIFERPLINDRDAVSLKENMVIVVHPHVLLSKGGGMWMGDVFAITENGCRRLHQTPQELHVIP
jgi:Xaa-Pro aminopeptidase